MKASDVATIRSSLRSMGLTRCRLLQNWYECSSQSTHIFTKPFCFHTSGDTLDKVKTSRSLSPSPKMTSLKVSKTGWSTSVAAHSTTRSDVFQNNPYTDSIEGISPHLLCNVHSSQLHRSQTSFSADKGNGLSEPPYDITGSDVTSASVDNTRLVAE